MKTLFFVTLKSAKLSPGHQVYLPSDIVQEAEVKEGDVFLIRVRHGVIELIPEREAARALDAGMDNIREASLVQMGEAWDNPEDEAWNEV